MSPHPQVATVAIEYPETDGKPMAETDVHRKLMTELIDALERHFQAQPEVYVSGNMLLYYEEGNPRKSVAPDVFVVHGVANHERRVYLLWQEGHAPSVVFEISSRSTYKEDLQRKWLLYYQLGVTEYYLYDPEYDYLKEGLVAYRPGDEGKYVEVQVNGGVIYSPALGLDVVNTGATLRLRDPQTGQFLPTRAELQQAAERAERLADKLRELGIDPEQV
jgi:Uma2 family endonuclease